MPVKPDSRFATLPVLRVEAPDGTTRHVVGLRIARPEIDPNGMTQHRIVHGEQLDLIAQRYYGSEGLWWRILDANPALYPLDLKPGDVLNVPAPGPASRATRARRF